MTSSRGNDTLAMTLEEVSAEVKKTAWEAWLAAESSWIAFPDKTVIQERFDLWWEKRSEEIWGELERLSNVEARA